MYGKWRSRQASYGLMINRHNGDYDQRMGDSCTLQHHSFQEKSRQVGGWGDRNGQREGKDGCGCDKYDHIPSGRCKWYTYSMSRLAVWRVDGIGTI